jgi:hypothetical protein
MLFTRNNLRRKYDRLYNHILKENNCIRNSNRNITF